MKITDDLNFECFPELKEIKGHIQLDLLRDGKVIKRLESENAITPALRNMLMNQFISNGVGIGRPFDMNSYFGGCFLLDGDIPFVDGVPPVTLPSNVNITAHAGQQQNSSATVIKRGSPNLRESHAGDNNSYVFVWDWRTHEGNGDIKSIALTHKTNGYNGIGTDETGQSYASLLGLTNLSFRDIYNQDIETDISANNGVIFNDDNTYYVVGYSNKVFTIEKRVKSISKFRFNDNRTIETHTIETTHTFPTGSWSGKSMTVYNGSAYFLASGGNRIIKICKISLADFTSEDLTINLPFDYSFPSSYPESWQANRLPIYDGYLYLVQANKVYKININNVADIKELDNPDGVQIATSVGPIYKSGDLLFAGNRNFGICIYKDTIRRGPTDVNFDSNTDYQNTMAATNLDGAITRINPNKQIYQFLAPNFITTAHNYNNKVTKTPDMTMKLTYTIREA